MIRCFSGDDSGLVRSSSIRQLAKKVSSLGRRRNRNGETETREVPANIEYPTWSYAEMDPLQRHEEVRDFLQTFGLSKNEDYLIDPTVRSIRMGLGWDKGTNRDADVDASVALFDDRLRAVDTVWYKKLRSTFGSVTHSGDNLTGVGEGDDEVITVELADLPLHVHYLLFTVCVFSFDLSFRQIRSAFVRMMHGKERYKNRELCHFSLTDMSGHAMVVGALTRKGPYWNFRTLGIPATGRTIQELLQNPRNLECLDSIPSYNPEMRQVTINVIRGTDLAAKDVTGIFKRTYSSDPYFVITFKNKRYTSEHRPKTLEPEWKSPPFQLGWMNEVETKALKVQIFDYDAIGADDFMGMIRIPGHALYNLGLGDHTYWFELGSSKEKAYRRETVSGRILIQFRVDVSQHNCDLCHDRLLVVLQGSITHCAFGDGKCCSVEMAAVCAAFCIPTSNQ